jgi:hypothetical protein
MDGVSPQLIEEHIRQTVAESTVTGALLDVQEAADRIAQVYGCQTFITSIATDLAEAAALARVPMKLTASIKT